MDLPFEISQVKTAFTRYHPTLAVLPDWVDREIMTLGIGNLKIEPPTINPITPEFDIDRIDLEVSPILPQFGKALESSDLLTRLERETPVDGTEIVSWMHDSASATIIASAREAEYNKHSQWAYVSGDPAAPGVGMAGLSFLSRAGYTVLREGATVNYPGGRLTMPLESSRDLITPDFLGWAATGKQYGYQWFGMLSQVRQIANKIEDPTGFLSYRGMKAPQYALAEAPQEQTMSTTEMIFSLNTPQRIKLDLRSPVNFTDVVDSAEVDLPAGECGLAVTAASYPAVPPLVYQLKPPDGLRNYAVLNRFETV